MFLYPISPLQLARQSIVPLTLRQMLTMGQGTLQRPDQIVHSARFVQQELPKRLARRLLDLQLLPHLVVSNPHIRQVYAAYFQTMETLRALPEVQTLQDNDEFTRLLRQLMDDNGVWVWVGGTSGLETAMPTAGLRMTWVMTPLVPRERLHTFREPLAKLSAAPMLDLLATGLREVRARPLVGDRLALDT